MGVDDDDYLRQGVIVEELRCCLGGISTDTLLTSIIWGHAIVFTAELYVDAKELCGLSVTMDTMCTKKHSRMIGCRSS